MVEKQGLYALAHQKIEELIPLLKGETLTREQWYKMCNTHPTAQEQHRRREAINAVLWNLSNQNKTKKIIRNGHGFKVVDDDLVPINFKGARGEPFDIVLPFGIHQYCKMYRKNIAVVFGSKDAGKTAIMLNIIRLNMNKHRTLYFSSEMVEDELADRLSQCKGLELGDWNFEAYERSYDFNEAIDPDGLNLIDFLELGGDEAEYFKGVALIRKIYDRLDKGIAIIACQKNQNAELPKGGSGLLEKARLALSLDPNKVTITVAKNWAEGVHSSPRGKFWTYQLVGGVNIVNPIGED